MECFERELHEYVVAVEREGLAEELARLDVDLPAVTIEGELYRRVVRCEETYTSAAGSVRVMRSLYRRLGEGERTVCPLELRAGMVEGRWTPLAARQAAFVVAHLTPQEGEDLFRELGNMTPSKSSLDRLPKQLSERWEAERERFEAALRTEETVPPEAVTVAVSLDGVMVPMKDGGRTQKRQDAKAQGKHTCGPAGYQEVGCGTLSFYDAEGERLSTVRLARMPEKHKATLKDTLSEEIAAVLAQRPDLTLVKLADGAKDNWTYLGAVLPQGIETLDFYHACEHLKAAFDAAYGENSAKSKAQFEKYRQLLRDEADGVEKVIRALCHLRDTRPRKRKLATELAYFRRHRCPAPTNASSRSPRMSCCSLNEQCIEVSVSELHPSVFPAAQRSIDPRSGLVRRHPLDEPTLQRAVKNRQRSRHSEARKWSHVAPSLRDPSPAIRL